MNVTGPGVFSLEGVGQWARTFAASVSQGWQVEHRPDGRHTFTERTFTPTLTFGGAATGMTFVSHGRYARVGELVVAHFRITLSALGTSTGSAQIGGFPFNANVGNGRAHSVASFGYVANMAGLTSPIGAYMSDGPPSLLQLYDYGATGGAVLDDTNFTASSDLIGQVIYRAG